MSGGGGKGGGGSTNLNYYGTLVGVFCWGPVDWLTALIYNGNYLWNCPTEGPLIINPAGIPTPTGTTPAGADLTADGYLDLTSSILDQSLVVDGGYVRVYPGQVSQMPDGAIAGHPAYNDDCSFWVKNFLFGQNSGTAPNFQAICGRYPRISTTIVAAVDNVVDNRQVNPIAVLAEIITDERGMGLDISQLDAASWLAAAHWCAQDQAHRDYTFCSPLFTDQTANRDLVSSLLDPFNGFLRWTPEGLLGCYIYEWGTNPGGLVTLDARYWLTPPEITDGAWEDVPTELLVSFTDQEYEFQANSLKIENLRAAQIRRVFDQGKLDLKHVTRSVQAQSIGVQRNLRTGLAPGKGTVKVRSAWAAGLLPGSKFLLDDQPQPGGTPQAQLARVDKVEIDPTDAVNLTFMIDPLLPVTAYTPSWTMTPPGTVLDIEEAPALVYKQAIPLPPGTWGWPRSVGIIACRPASDVVGFFLYFGASDGGSFDQLGTQTGFGVRVTLVNAVSAAATTMRLQLTDGASGPDAYLAANTPGGNTVEAQDDTLLAVFFQLDGSGRVALDGYGNALIEFVSIEQRSAVTSDTWDYTVLRGRLSSTAAAWAASYAGWIIPRANLTAWRHTQFASLVGDPLLFRMVAYTPQATDESTPVPETAIILPSIPAPTGLTAATGTGQVVTLAWTGPGSAALEFNVYRATGPGFTDEALIASISASSFVDIKVTLGTEYRYRVTAVDQSEEESGFSGSVIATPNVITAAMVDLTPPADPTAPTLDSGDSGFYLSSAGTVLATLALYVSALPAKAIGQNILYRLAGGSSGAPWQIGGVAYEPGTIKIEDLTPGQSYDVAVQAYTISGVPSDVVLATGSPFTAPAKTSPPTAPTGGILNANGVTPAFIPGTSQFLLGCVVSWAPIPDLDLAYYEVKATYNDTDSDTIYTWSYPADVTEPMQVTDTSLCIYNATGSPGYVRIRSVDTSGNVSAWVRIGNANSAMDIGTGTIATQSQTSSQLTGVALGSLSDSSVQAITALYQGSVIYVATGGDTSETFTIDLTGRGFTAAPSLGLLDSYSATNVSVKYDPTNMANTSSSATVTIKTTDGSNLVAGDYGIQFYFSQ